ncbi:MAG: heavy metal-binding domain-containing protein, partial [Vicinamibacteria bacterium]
MSFAAALVALFLGTAQATERETFEAYLCARHPDEQAVAPRRCPVCGENLVLRILVPSFSCPMHPSIDEEREGRCPICKMNLVATTREAQWVCPG